LISLRLPGMYYSMISLFFVIGGGVFLVGVLVLGPSLVFVRRKRVRLLWDKLERYSTCDEVSRSTKYRKVIIAFRAVGHHLMEPFIGHCRLVNEDTLAVAFIMTLSGDVHDCFRLP
jgi:hypothetical protein